MHQTHTHVSGDEFLSDLDIGVCVFYLNENMFLYTWLHKTVIWSDEKHSNLHNWTSPVAKQQIAEINGK